MSNGKLEGLVTVPSGGWTVSLTGSSSGDSVLPAGEYYMSSAGDGSNSLLDELASQWSTTTGDTVSLSISGGESGTGKVTITSDATLGVTWDSGDSDTTLRTLLGFDADGDLSGSMSYTSRESARAIWLPNTGYQTLNVGNNWAGIRRSNKRTMVNMAGYSWSLAGQRRAERRIVWPAVARERTWIVDETTTGQSAQQFWRDCVLAEGAWAAEPGGPLRFYEDADTDGTHRTYMATEWSEFAPNTFRTHFVSYWGVATGVLVERPGAGVVIAVVDSTHSIDLETSSTQYAKITDANQTGLDFSGGKFTLEGWVKFESLPSGNRYDIIGKWGGGSDNSYVLLVKEDSGTYTLETFAEDGSSNRSAVKATWSSPSTDTWYHIAWSFDSSESSSTAENAIYIDGTSQSLTSVTDQNPSGVRDGGGEFTIGNREGGSRSFDGKMHDWRAWSSIRTQSEISNNRTTDLTGSEDNLVGWWYKRDSHSDETSNGNDLTAQNSPTFVTDVPH